LMSAEKMLPQIIKNMGVKLLLDKAHVPGIRFFETYRKEGGYQAVEKALKQMDPASIVEEVKKSGVTW
jgi:NADH-quinone oxidoreductase subunit F